MLTSDRANPPPLVHLEEKDGKAVRTPCLGQGLPSASVLVGGSRSSSSRNLLSFLCHSSWELAMRLHPPPSHLSRVKSGLGCGQGDNFLASFIHSVAFFLLLQGGMKEYK